MPIDVEGVLIWSGGRGLGAIALVYRQGSQPRERLHDHEYAQCARQPRHAPHLRRVLIAQGLVSVARFRQPAEGVRRRFTRSLLVAAALLGRAERATICRP